jgi:hypothetical protein
VKYIDEFLEKSDSHLAEVIINNYLYLIDGFTSLPVFQAYYISDNKYLSNLNVSCKTYSFNNLDDLIIKMKGITKTNHLILYQIKPFQIRCSEVSLEYDLIGYNTKMKRRDLKLNQLLDE